MKDTLGTIAAILFVPYLIAAIIMFVGGLARSGKYDCNIIYWGDIVVPTRIIGCALATPITSKEIK